MRRWTGLLLALALALALPAGAGGYSERQLAQQQRMKDCAAEAKAQGLRGEARTAFFKTCLSPGEVAVDIPADARAEPVPGPATTAATQPPEQDR